jgi:arylsulfatase A
VTTRAILSLFASALAQAACAAADRPNVVLMLADDFGYECVSANGGESYRTPNLDRLAAAGARFERCHVQPLCTPTRVQLMTGRYNVRNYVNFGTLLRTETTFGHLFKRAGYATGICGKWQLGHEADAPQHFGFDEACLWQHTRRPPRYANPGLEYDGVEKDFSKGEYGPDLVNAFALDFLSRHKAQPFFLYYPMLLTHAPYQPTPDSPDWDPKAVGENVNDRVPHFADMVVYADKLVGRVDAKLAELGLRDNTLLIFLGDNGTGATVTSRFKGRDYRGGKGKTTENGTHVPLIVSWPSVIRRGLVCGDLVGGADVLPTVCEAAGLAAPDGADGVSFLPQVRGERGSPREWLYTWYSPRMSDDMTVREWAWDARYKLYRDGRFFDLQSDPGEASPLKADEAAGEAAAAAAKLRAALGRFASARPAELDKQAAPPKAGKAAKKRKKAA